jgi:hypothetical protein
MFTLSRAGIVLIGFLLKGLPKAAKSQSAFAGEV